MQRATDGKSQTGWHKGYCKNAVASLVSLLCLAQNRAEKLGREGGLELPLPLRQTNIDIDTDLRKIQMNIYQTSTDISLCSDSEVLTY